MAKKRGRKKTKIITHIERKIEEKIDEKRQVKSKIDFSSQTNTKTHVDIRRMYKSANILYKQAPKKSCFMLKNIIYIDVGI